MGVSWEAENYLGLTSPEKHIWLAYISLGFCSLRFNQLQIGNIKKKYDEHLPDTNSVRMVISGDTFQVSRTDSVVGLFANTGLVSSKVSASVDFSTS